MKTFWYLVISLAIIGLAFYGVIPWMWVAMYVGGLTVGALLIH